MVLVTTRGTAKYGLRGTRESVHVSALAARLTRICGGYLNEVTTRPCHLITKHLGEARPTRVCDTTSTMSANHPRYIQMFQHDCAVALGKSCRLNVQKVLALSSYFTVDTCNACLGFCLVLRPFLPSTLSACAAAAETSSVRWAVSFSIAVRAAE